jgi:hypothetical protein
VAGNTGAEVLVNGDYGKDGEEAQEETEDEEGNTSSRQVPPLLVGTVVATTAADAGEARRTAARLERMGREFQREWLREVEAASETIVTAAGSGEDG